METRSVIGILKAMEPSRAEGAAGAVDTIGPGGTLANGRTTGIRQNCGTYRSHHSYDSLPWARAMEIVAGVGCLVSTGEGLMDATEDLITSGKMAFSASISEVVWYAMGSGSSAGDATWSAARAVDDLKADTIF